MADKKIRTSHFWYFTAKQDKPILRIMVKLGIYRPAKHYVMLSSTVTTQLPYFETFSV